MQNHTQNFSAAVASLAIMIMTFTPLITVPAAEAGELAAHVLVLPQIA